MKHTKDFKNNKGITMISLILTVAVMFIISSVTVYTSYDRFEINKYNKMINDLKYLNDKVSNYYLKHDALPILRDDENNQIRYTYSTLSFSEETYYIIDLEAMDGMSLNYGKEGFENPNESKDVYIINSSSHQIYYVKGMKLKDKYYYTAVNRNNITDTVPPSKPQIKVVSGEKVGVSNNQEDVYSTNIEIEIIPGIDKVTNIDRTTYYVEYNGGIISAEKNITTLTNNIYEMTENGEYTIVIRTYNKEGKFSEASSTFSIAKP